MSVCPFCCTSQGSFVTMGHNGDESEGVPVCTSCRNTMEDLFESDAGRCRNVYWDPYPSTCTKTAVVDQRRGQTPYIRIKLCAACFCERVSATPERAAAIHRVCGTS
jgi:hypothetical protein